MIRVGTSGFSYAHWKEVFYPKTVPQQQWLEYYAERFDCVEPIVWNTRTGNVVGGHQRLKVLSDRGDTMAPCVVVDLDQADEQVLNLALNRIRGDWDTEKLSQLVTELSNVPKLDLELTGFDSINFTVDQFGL